MGTFYSPPIIHDKLVFCVDAENRKSIRGYKKSYRCNLNIDLHGSMTIILNFILKIFLFGVKIG